MSQAARRSGSALRWPQSSVSVLAWLRFRVWGHPGSGTRGAEVTLPCAPFNVCVSSRNQNPLNELGPRPWLERGGTGVGGGLEHLI